jgi:hypothetical protein
MPYSNMPSDQELPSTSKLIGSTVLAAVAAGVLLVTVVMPAEYGIDPTGIGNLIGLKKMGEIRVSLDKEAAEDKAKNSGINPDATPKPVSVNSVIKNDEMQIKLAPNEGAEVKLAISKGNKVQYTWSTDGGKANFDTHADSEKLNIDYHPYGKGAEQLKEGEIEAAFDGSHGWFWRNRTGSPITITLKTTGQYTDIKRLK